MTFNARTSLEPILGGIAAIGSGRAGAFVAAMIGLLGVIIGGVALAHARRRTRIGPNLGAAPGMDRSIMAILIGLVAIGLGGVFVATAEGGLGTGNGLGGAIVAVLLGLAATVLGGWPGHAAGVSRDLISGDVDR